jgi:hypothetical protein
VNMILSVLGQFFRLVWHGVTWKILFFPTKFSAVFNTYRAS